MVSPPSVSNMWVKGYLRVTIGIGVTIGFKLLFSGIYGYGIAPHRGTLTRSKVGCPVLFWYSSDPPVHVHVKDAKLILRVQQK